MVQCINIRQVELGSRHFLVGQAMSSLGGIFTMQRRLEEVCVNGCCMLMAVVVIFIIIIIMIIIVIACFSFFTSLFFHSSFFMINFAHHHHHLPVRPNRC